MNHEKLKCYRMLIDVAARSLSEYPTKVKILMALPDKEDEQNARRRSHSYVEDVLRNLTRSGRCQ